MAKRRTATRKTRRARGKGLFASLYTPVSGILGVANSAVRGTTRVVGKAANTTLKTVNRVGRRVTKGMNNVSRGVVTRIGKGLRRRSTRKRGTRRH